MTRMSSSGIRRAGGSAFFANRAMSAISPTSIPASTSARGEIVHLLHGDDIVRPGFYEALQRGFDAVPNDGAAFCRSHLSDADGSELDMTPRSQDSGLAAGCTRCLATEQRIMTPSIAVRRKVYEQLGGFDRRLTVREDWEMWVRIAAHFPIWYERQPLAVYRMHAASNTGRHLRERAGHGL